jgi:hypothetical protein
MSYAEEDTCMLYEEEDTCSIKGLQDECLRRNVCYINQKSRERQHVLGLF